MSALRTSLQIDPSEVRYISPRDVSAHRRALMNGAEPVAENFYPPDFGNGAAVVFGSWDTDDDMGPIEAAKATGKLVVDTRSCRIADHRGRCVSMGRRDKPAKAFIMVATMIGAPAMRMLSTDLIDVLWNGKRSDPTHIDAARRNLSVVVLTARIAVNLLGLEIVNCHGFGYKIRPKTGVRG
jgi:hypothetical protein